MDSHELRPCPAPVAVLFRGEVYCPEGGCSPCEGPDFRFGGDGCQPLYPGPVSRGCATCGKTLMTETIP